jgi:hypothetical protein
VDAAQAPEAFGSWRPGRRALEAEREATDFETELAEKTRRPKWKYYDFPASGNLSKARSLHRLSLWFSGWFSGLHARRKGASGTLRQSAVVREGGKFASIKVL